MPILGEADQRLKRRAPVWLLVPTVAVVLLLSGTVVLSWFGEVSLVLGGHGLGWGYNGADNPSFGIMAAKATLTSCLRWTLSVPSFPGGDAFYVWWE